MTVRTKFRWLFLLGTIVLLSLSAYLYDHNQRWKTEIERNELINSIVEGVFELSILNNEFQVRREDRISQQWDSRHASLTNLLLVAGQRFADSPDRLLINRLRAEQAAFRAVFLQISSSLKGGQNLGGGQPLNLIAALNSQMSQQALEMVGITDQLLANSLASMISAQRRVNLLAVALALTLAAFGIATGVIARNLLRSVRSLTEGALEFGRGNLDHRIRVGKRDELGLLASVFNQMAISRATAERMLAESRQRVEAVVDLAVDAIVTIDDGGIIESANQAVRAVFGYAPEELPGRNVSVLMPEPYHGEHDGYLDHYLTTGEKRIIGIGREVVGRRKDGSEFPMELGVSEVRLQGHRSFVGIIRDISERKKAEEELRRSQVLLSITLSSIGDAVIASDREGRVSFLNPVASALIGWNLEEAMGKPVQEVFEILKEETLETVEDPVRKVLRENRVVGLANHTLLISKDGTRRLIADSLTKASLGKDQISLSLDVPDGVPEIKCRNQQIQQVLMNLVGNARDALNQRYAGYDPAKTLAITVRPFEEEGAAWVRTTLEDRGTGMSPQVAERAFDPFFTTKPRDQGTGLGLSVSHGIVEEHKGRLRIESREGEYTRVHLELRVDNGWSRDGSAQQEEEEMGEKEG